MNKLILLLFTYCFLKQAAPAEPDLWWDDCGESKYTDAGASFTTTKIINGERARANEFPWQASLQRHDEHYCGAVIIKPNWVLTAGHCVEGETDRTRIWRVVVGEHKLNKDQGVERVHSVARIILHEEYLSNDRKIRNDIALIQLSEPIEFNANVKPACQPRDVTYAGTRAVVSGWGSVNGNDPSYPRILQWTDQTAISQSKCRRTFSRKELTDNMICGYRRGVSTCFGDSGGPFVIQKSNGRFELVGLVSWGYGCSGRTPSVYTRVSQYITWITDTVARFGGGVTEPSTPVTSPASTETMSSSTATSTTSTTTELPIEQGLWWDDCGRSKYSDAGLNRLGAAAKIINGEEARPNEFPWQISLQHPQIGHYCGGVIIHPRWVLTAGHCVYNINDNSIQNWKVVVGEQHLTEAGGTEHVHRIRRIILHENYDDDTLFNDIALLKLSTPIEFNENVQPACQPRDVSYNGVRAVVSGWGATRESENRPGYPDILQWIHTSVISRSNCIRQGIARRDLDTNMLCTARAGVGSCSGDSGGPVVTQNDNGRFEIIGLVSWGYGCDLDSPSVNNKVNRYISWVSDKL